MPSRTSPRHTSAAVDLDLTATSGPSKPWRAAAHAPDPDYDEDMDSDGDENNAALAHYEPRHLEDPWAYTFQVNLMLQLAGYSGGVSALSFLPRPPPCPDTDADFILFLP